MTRSTNAKIAGFTFLFYIAVGITTLALSSRAIGTGDIAAKLASIAQHVTAMRVLVVLYLLLSFAPLVLAVTLYALTRDQDPDLARLGLICRVLEGIADSIPATLGLVWLATATEAKALNIEAVYALGAFQLRPGEGTSAMFFAVGSTLFSWLLLRGRMIPIALGRLGVGASVLLVVILPLQLAGLLGGPENWLGPVTWLMWLPMLVFEVTLALWLIIKGVAKPNKPPVSED